MRDIVPKLALTLGLTLLRISSYGPYIGAIKLLGLLLRRTSGAAILILATGATRILDVVEFFTR